MEVSYPFEWNTAIKYLTIVSKKMSIKIAHRNLEQTIHPIISVSTIKFFHLRFLVVLVLNIKITQFKI